MAHWIRFLMVLAMVYLSFGCDVPLDKALDDVRSNAPEVCEKFCEKQTECEWNGSMKREDDPDAFTNEIRRCTISCAYITSDGIYAFEIEDDDLDDRHYTTFISGSDFTDVLTCLYDNVTPGCDPEQGFLFNPEDKGECEDANQCYKKLDVDIEYDWELLGAIGHCRKDGKEYIEFHP